MEVQNQKSNTNTKDTLKKRITRVIINPQIKEKINDNCIKIIESYLKKEDFNPLDSDKNLDSDPDNAVSDPYKVLGNPKASLELKDLAYKIITIRSCNDLG